ncbi:membrane protein [Sinosporangium siamense]|uniref:Membrane protein n=2 Tax=Sinosporangium siamense TaxID=1367973 RepID=A0A919V9R4_9ACTN|nr:membrane protein [Sinosporangium siamense]
MSGLGGLVVAFFAVFGGMALVTGTGVIIESGLRSSITDQRLTGADVLVSAPQSHWEPESLPIGLPERAVVPAKLIDDLTALPGVATATGDVTFPTALLSAAPGTTRAGATGETSGTRAAGGAPDTTSAARTGRGTLETGEHGAKTVNGASDATLAAAASTSAAQTGEHGAKAVTGPSASAAPTAKVVGGTGHGWASVALVRGAKVIGSAPRAADEVAVSAAHAVRRGTDVEVVAAGKRAVYRVTAIVDTPGAPALWFADRTAAELAGRTGGPRAGTVDLIGLRAAPGTGPGALAEAVERRLGDDYVVSTGSAKGDAESPGTAAARSMLIALPTSIGGISLLIVGFVVGGGISLSITRQRRELALLRAAGATPRQVRGLVAVQGMTAALAALLPGAAAGYALAGWFGELLVHLGMLPERMPLSYSPLPAVAAALLLLGVVRVSAWATSLPASRMPAVSAVRESAAEPRTPSSVRYRSGLLLIGASLLLATPPLYIRGEIAVVGPGTAALVSVIGLALAGPRLVQGATGLLARRLPAHVPAPLWLAVSNTRGYALRTAGAIAALGMAVTLTTSISLSHTTVMRATDEETAEILKADAVVTAPAYGGIPDGLMDDVRRLPGVTAAVATSTTTILTSPFGDGGLQAQPAAVLGPDAGAVVDLGVTGGSLADLKGAAVAVDDRSGDVGDRRTLVLGDGAEVKARVVATYSRVLGLGPVVLSRDLVAGHTTTGLDSTVLVRGDAPLDRLTGHWPGLGIAADSDSPQAGRTSSQLWINVAVLGVLLGYVLVSVANRLVATTAARGPELTAIKRLGATPRQLTAMIRWEALLIALTASLAGLAMSAVPLVLLGIGFLGRPWPAGPLWLVPAAVAVVCVVVWLAFDLTARRLIRRA